MKQGTAGYTEVWQKKIWGLSINLLTRTGSKIDPGKNLLDIHPLPSSLKFDGKSLIPT